jgi:hypothetical protein
MLTHTKLQFEDVRAKSRTTQNLYSQATDDNRMLEIDIEKLKEMVRNLSNANDELIGEMDKIMEQDEGIRYILNRKTRIDSVIVNTRRVVERNQVREGEMVYGERRGSDGKRGSPGRGSPKRG